MDKLTYEVAVADIEFGDRHRKNLGDLETLAASIQEQGLLQPVGITESNELVFGERRLRACRDILGWQAIPARVVHVTSIVEGEYHENEIRLAFTPEERVHIGRAVETEASKRHGGDRRSDDFQERKNSPLKGKSSEIAAQRAGFGNDRTYRQAKEIVEAAEAEPERFQGVLDQMNRTGKVGGAHPPPPEVQQSSL